MKSPLSGFVKGLGDAVASSAEAASTAVEASLAAAKTSAEKASHSTLELGKSAGEAVGNAAQATSNFASKAARLERVYATLTSSASFLFRARATPRRLDELISLPAESMYSWRQKFVADENRRIYGSFNMA